MAIVKIKRRNSAPALTPGTAPLGTGAGGILSGEPVYDANNDTLYIGKGDDGSGNSTAISPIGGSGAFVLNSRIGAANGVAGLDASGKLPAAQLPASVTGAMVYQGVWNASTNSPALASGVGTKGAFYKVSVAGNTTIDGNGNWTVGDVITFDGTTWDKIEGGASDVSSVAGRVGAITLTSADLTDSGATGRSLVGAGTAAAAKTILSLAVADVSGAAPLASPGFTGTPTVPTAAGGTNTTQAASTAFVASAVAGLAPLTSPTFTGTPAGPTAGAGTNTTQFATTAFVQTALAAFSPTGIDGGVI